MSAPRSMVIFSAQFLPGYGGVEQFTASLAKELSKLGVTVTVIAANNHGAAPVERLAERAVAYRLPCHPLAGGSFPTLRHNAELRRMWSQLSAGHYDAVLVNTRFYTLSILGLRFAHRRGIRSILLDHGSSHIGFGRPAVDWAVHAYEHVMTSIGRRYGADYYGISQKSAEWLGHFGITACGSLNNAIDVHAFRGIDSGRDFRGELGIPESSFVVCFVGRLIPGKGTAVLRDVARILGEHGSDIRLLVAGDGPDLDMLQDAALPNLGVLGRLSRGDVSALLRESDALFLPTRSEGFCTALLEAAAWEVPPVVTDVGGAREVVPDPSFGTVLDGTDPDPSTCAKVLEEYALNRDEVRRMGGRCRARVETEFSWSATAHRLLDAFDGQGRAAETP